MITPTVPLDTPSVRPSGRPTQPSPLWFCVVSFWFRSSPVMVLCGPHVVQFWFWLVVVGRTTASPRVAVQTRSWCCFCHL